MALLVDEVVAVIRGCLRTPRTWVPMTAIIAFGIGINAAVFNVTRSVLFEKPFLENLDRLVRIGLTAPRQSADAARLWDLDFVAWRDETRVCESIAAYESRDVAMTSGGEPFLGSIAAVSSSLFSVLSVRPFLGRRLDR